MGSLSLNLPMTVKPIIRTHRFAKFEWPSNKIQFSRRRKICPGISERRQFWCRSNADEEQLDSPQELRVPSSWLEPSRAAEESAWLRGKLQQWLDEEYCPEATNIEISRVAADSYYKSLVEKRSDLGDILLKMAVELESISYQDSFHGAFSSANAAVNLIVQRILQD